MKLFLLAAGINLMNNQINLLLKVCLISCGNSDIEVLKPLATPIEQHNPLANATTMESVITSPNAVMAIKIIKNKKEKIPVTVDGLFWLTKSVQKTSVLIRSKALVVWWVSRGCAMLQRRNTLILLQITRINHKEKGSWNTFKESRQQKAILHCSLQWQNLPKACKKRWIINKRTDNRRSKAGWTTSQGDNLGMQQYQEAQWPCPWHSRLLRCPSFQVCAHIESFKTDTCYCDLEIWKGIQELEDIQLSWWIWGRRKQWVTILKPFSKFVGRIKLLFYLHEFVYTFPNVLSKVFGELPSWAFRESIWNASTIGADTKPKPFEPEKKRWAPRFNPSEEALNWFNVSMDKKNQRVQYGLLTDTSIELESNLH